jgi:hypothetical protein
MNEDDLYDNLPDDPGLAFVKLEKFYKQAFEEAIPCLLLQTGLL